MISIEEAFEFVVGSVVPLPAVSVPLAEGLGLCLVADAVADIDSPPFDKSMMDGFAVDAETAFLESGELSVLETVMAGTIPQCEVSAGNAIQIMTGAMIPKGATAVVPIEQTEFDSAARKVKIVKLGRFGQHILRRGENTTAGEVVLKSGVPLSASAVGALAEFGHSCVTVFRRPRVAVLATGDELVACCESPGVGQIRNSNEGMLCAQIERAGGIAVPLGIAGDNERELSARIEKGLECDLLVLSGGVSAGKKDLVPAELQRADVEQIFHKIRLKPGKPLWFGQRTGSQDRENSGQSYVFGLPGNPVASMVCFELFVRTALRRMMGCQQVKPVSFDAKLVTPYQLRGDRCVHHPAIWNWGQKGEAVVQLVSWKGSSDLRSTVDANCTVAFTPEKTGYSLGDFVSIFPWG